MCEFITLNLATIISIVLSGMISLIISRWYYYKSNRASAEDMIIYNIIVLLEYDNFYKKEIERYTENYYFRYLTEAEKKVIRNLKEQYINLCSYDEEIERCRVLMDYFEYRLKQSEIDIEYETEDEYGIRTEPIPNLYQVEYRVREMPYAEEEEIKAAFNEWLDIFMGGADVEFFGDYNINEVLKKARRAREWKSKFQAYETAKNKFLELWITKKVSKQTKDTNN